MYIINKLVRVMASFTSSFTSSTKEDLYSNVLSIFTSWDTSLPAIEFIDHIDSLASYSNEYEFDDIFSDSLEHGDIPLARFVAEHLPDEIDVFQGPHQEDIIHILEDMKSSGTMYTGNAILVLGDNNHDLPSQLETLRNMKTDELTITNKCTNRQELEGYVEDIIAILSTTSLETLQSVSWLPSAATRESDVTAVCRLIETFPKVITVHAEVTVKDHSHVFTPDDACVIMAAIEQTGRMFYGIRIRATGLTTGMVDHYKAIIQRTSSEAYNYGVDHITKHGGYRKLSVEDVDTHATSPITLHLTPADIVRASKGGMCWSSYIELPNGTAKLDYWFWTHILKF